MIRRLLRTVLWLLIAAGALLLGALPLRAVPKVVLVLHSEGAFPAAAAQFERQFGAALLRIVIAGERSAPDELADAQVVFLEHPAPEFLRQVRPTLEAAHKRGARVLSDVPEVLERHAGFAPDPVLSRQVLPYFRGGGADNCLAMLALLYKAAGGKKTIEIPPPQETPAAGLYHPAAPRLFTSLDEYLAWYRKARPAQGRLAVVSFYSSFLRDRELEPVDALIAALEKKGLAAAGVFGWPQSAIEPVLRGPAADPIYVNLTFTLSLTKPEDAGALERQGAHVINLLTASSGYDEWAKSDRGVEAGRTASLLDAPERNGATEPVLVATREADPRTGIYRLKPVGERVEMAAARAARWVVLRDKPNWNKRLVILYYNNPPGKGNIGASYLNLPPSILAVLERLREAGYNAGGRLPTTDELLAQLERVGRNVERWAPGELDRMAEQGGVTLLPVERYRQWFDRLPDPFRQAIDTRWGQPEASQLMTLRAPDGRRFFVIPGVRLGNIFLGPQLLRASAEEYASVQHSGSLPPHHGYVASYLHYRYDFQADAIIHMGRHGTLEWLPGKNAGQAGWDTPEVLLGDLPNLNYYIMDGGGEALQARRRSAAVDISHLTPLLAAGGAQERFRTLASAIANWKGTHETSPGVAARYASEAIAEAKRLHLDTQLSLPVAVSEALPRLDGFLETTEEAPIPLGLPVLGQAPPEDRQKEGLEQVVRSAFTAVELRQIGDGIAAWTEAVIAGTRPPVAESIRPPLRDKVFRTLDEASTWLVQLRRSPERELAALIEVLNGRFLPSGLVGDPLRVPSALPSGRNLHSTDPALFPTKAAWEVGKTMAAQLIDHYRQDHQGAWPERISMVLWSGETGRHQGAMEAEALYLMGVEPEWNARGVVDGVKLIPEAELGRPRVSVVFTVSGLYRDSMGDKIRLLDRAARLAAAAGDNTLSRQNRQVERELLARGVAPEEAGHLAGARVFGAAPGTYGNGVSSAVEVNGEKGNRDAVANLYLNRTNFVYTEKVWGESKPALLASQLRGNQVILHSRSSNLYGVADNDDVYQYVGGLDLATRSLGGAPEVLFNNLRASGRERVEGAREVLAGELHSRNWNPKWLRAMKESGYSGARMMANGVEFLYGWQATSPDSVDASAWKKTYDVYVADEYGLGMPQFLTTSSPHAQQKLLARLIEVHRQGIYRLTRAEEANLLRSYVHSVAANGVACSAAVCANRRLREYVAARGRQLGPREVSRAELERFSRQFARATAGSAASAPSLSSPKRAKRDRSWLERLPLIDLRLSPRHFAQRPFGIGWSYWLISWAAGSLVAWVRRRRRPAGSPSVISGRADVFAP
jgi:cobaltochelatase CobN